MYYGWMIIEEEEKEKIINEYHIVIKKQNDDLSYEVEIDDKDMERINNSCELIYWGLIHRSN